MATLDDVWNALPVCMTIQVGGIGSSCILSAHTLLHTRPVVHDKRCQHVSKTHAPGFYLIIRSNISTIGSTMAVYMNPCISVSG
jgi:hypothetical protein